MSKESEFLARLKEAFKDEAEEHRAAIMSGLLELERGESGPERDAVVIETVFREAHSLKGAARAVDIGGIERLCQSVETVFSALKKEYRRPREKVFTTLYSILDLVAELTMGDLSAPARVEGLVALLEAEARGAPDDATRSRPGAPVENSPGTAVRGAMVTMSTTVRLSAARLGSILLRGEELLTVKQAAARTAVDLRELQALQGYWRKEWLKVAPAVKKLRQQAAGNPDLLQVLTLLDLYNPFAETVRQKIDALSATAEGDSLHARERVDMLLGEIRTALMLPFSTLLEAFPRMVRDLAHEESKEVIWQVHGEQTQIDRRVLEEIKDSLIHMVRNCVSHGIESPGKRVERGKPRAGTVSLRIERGENEKVELTLSDDGAGVDLVKVKAAAVAKGFVTSEAADALEEKDALQLIFLSELSTSSLITDISGRGLGLAIARERIERVGGQVTVETKEGAGTVFRVQIPLTLATFRGVLVRCRGQSFVIPTAHVEKVLRVDRAAVVLVENHRTIPVDGHAVSLVELGDVLGLPADDETGREDWPTIVLHVSGTRIAFAIDEVLGEQEVLVKNLGRQLARVRNVSGATVLATGAVVPILSPADLLKSVSLLPSLLRDETPRIPQETAQRKILVAEDSVTSRMLLKNILESAGYRVTTAVDGLEAFASLRVNEFDLLVSDVDMPRMDGFALCEKVRGFPRTAALPIVLVTSLDSREDREKGIDAGANAYIAKTSFDQSNLIEVVRRLL
jgi:two-component system, chemotaxis family, sensor kinase CheA